MVVGDGWVDRGAAEAGERRVNVHDAAPGFQTLEAKRNHGVTPDRTMSWVEPSRVVADLRRHASRVGVASSFKRLR